MSALSLLNWSVGRPNVVSLKLYDSFRKSLDSFVDLLWTPSIRTAMNKTDQGVLILSAKCLVNWRSSWKVIQESYECLRVTPSLHHL